ncbi:MAG: energy transducer TonB [Flavobacteriales bacterium]|nr:energy transducer TonB [Flavobacteriales bacterium]
MKISYLIFFVALSTNVFAQSEDSTSQEIYEWFHVTEKAEFTGGDSAREKFIQDNIDIPEVVLNSDEDIHCLIIVRFVVNQDGALSNVHVEENMSPCKNEYLIDAAVEVVKKMPKWKPAMIDGKPVRMQFILPIRVNIDGETKPRKKKK